MSDTRSTKRRRAASESRNESQEKDSIILDEDVTIPDGNVLLMAQNVAFRVHKSSLSRVSDVFRDLFTLPPSGDNETLEGLPCVQVWDDPEDLRILLLVVCCGTNYYYENDEVKPVPFRVLASLIRMGHKYAIQPVLNDALSRLKKYYTSELAAWIDVERRNRFVSDVDPRDAVTVIQLARLTNTPILLPTAYFIACQLTHSVYADNNKLPLSVLSPEDIASLVAARIGLLKVAYGRMMSLVTCLPTKHCRRSKSCAQAALSALKDHQTSKHNPCEERFFDLMQDWLWDVPAGRQSICAECRAYSQEFEANLRSALWDVLPTHFKVEVDGWPTETKPIYE